MFSKTSNLISLKNEVFNVYASHFRDIISQSCMVDSVWEMYKICRLFQYKKYSLTDIEIHIMKIRWSHNSIIYVMGVPIIEKMVFYWDQTSLFGKWNETPIWKDGVSSVLKFIFLQILFLMCLEVLKKKRPKKHCIHLFRQHVYNLCG